MQGQIIGGTETNNQNTNDMDFLLILVLLGVVCLLVYAFAIPSNALLVTALVLEIVGILLYIILGKRQQ